MTKKEWDKARHDAEEITEKSRDRDSKEWF